MLAAKHCADRALTCNAAAVRKQQQQPQRSQSAPKAPLYTFFNKLSVIPWAEETHADPAPPPSAELLPAHIRLFLEDFRFGLLPYGAWRRSERESAHVTNSALHPSLQVAPVADLPQQLRGD
jgi:hypothetical protein